MEFKDPNPGRGMMMMMMMMMTTTTKMMMILPYQKENYHHNKYILPHSFPKFWYMKVSELANQSQR
jgi:hypothetical protein